MSKKKVKDPETSHILIRLIVTSFIKETQFSPSSYMDSVLDVFDRFELDSIITIQL